MCWRVGLVEWDASRPWGVGVGLRGQVVRVLLGSCVGWGFCLGCKTYMVLLLGGGLAYLIDCNNLLDVCKW